MTLRGKTILLSGAGSGMGRAAARRFAELGAELVLVGRRLEALQETLADLGKDAHCLSLDHSDDAAVAACVEAMPVLDGMFLSAGQLVTGGVESTPVADFDRMIAANLRGPWLLCHHLGPKLNAGASVVLVGSNIGLRAIPDSAAYSVSKAGLHMLAKVLAQEWALRGIRCNAIAPGPVHTAMIEERLKHSLDAQRDLAHLSRVNPLQRLGREEEIAALGAHLLDDENAWTTGAVIPIDGGADAVF